MSRATGRGPLPRLRESEQAAEMPARCVGPSRPRRGVRKPWGKRWAAKASRGRRTKRRWRFSVWGTGCMSAERLQECRWPRGRRPPAETAEAVGANEALETPGTATSIEIARDPEIVWINGVVGEPKIVGPTGSVWVTGIGDEETDYRSPRGCERKGRPGFLGHGSILELWLKVQAMRAASGCGEESRVELCPVPAGEGPVERGVPGRAAWVETSRGGLTGPWVKGQARAVPRAIGMPAVASCERPSGLCGQGQAMRVPSNMDSSAGLAPCLWRRGHAVGMHGWEEIGGGLAPGLWGKGQTKEVPGSMGCPEAAGVPRAVEEERDCEATPGLWGRRQSTQVPGALGESVCGNTSGLWGREQVIGVPNVEEETRSVGASGAWWKRQTVEETGSGGVPGLWGTGQAVGVPCAVEEEARYGGDPGFQERGQALWVETGAGGDPESWGTTQTREVSRTGEEEADSRGAPSLLAIEQSMRVPKIWGEETSYGSVPSRWGTEQPVEGAQAVVVPQALGEETGYGGIPGLWSRQQALRMPPAETVPGAVEEMCCGSGLSQWERRRAMGEQETLVPAALGVSGPVDQETGCAGVSCLCRKRQAVGLSEMVGIPEAAGVPKHRCTPVGFPTAVNVPRSESVPAAVWMSGPMGQESSPGDALSMWERVRTARRPMASGMPMVSEELWSVGEGTGSGAFPGPWGRRQAVSVPVAPRVSLESEVPGPMGEEPGSGGIPRLWGKRQAAVATEVPTPSRVPGPLGVEPGSGSSSGLLGRRQPVQVPVAVGVSTPGGVPMVPRWPRLVRDETASVGASVGDAGLWGGRETSGVPADSTGPTMGLPTSAGIAGPMGQKTGSGGISGLSGGRVTAGVPVALGLRTATMLPGLAGEEICSGGLLCLSGRRQTAGMPVAARVSMAVGMPTGPGPLVEDSSSQDVSGIWGRREATEVPVAANAAGPVEAETGSDDVSSLWRRQARIGPETLRGPQSLGVLAAVGVPVPGQVPAAVWVTGSIEETNGGVSDLTAVRRGSTEEPGALGEETGGRSILGLAGTRQAGGMLHTCGDGARLRGCPGSVREETDDGNDPGVSGTRPTLGIPEPVEMSPVSGEETGFGHFRGHPQQRARRQAGGVSGNGVRRNTLGENYVEVERLRGASQ